MQAYAVRVGTRVARYIWQRFLDVASVDSLNPPLQPLLHTLQQLS